MFSNIALQFLTAIYHYSEPRGVATSARRSVSIIQLALKAPMALIFLIENVMKLVISTYTEINFFSNFHLTKDSLVQQYSKRLENTKIYKIINRSLLKF